MHSIALGFVRVAACGAVLGQIHLQAQAAPSQAAPLAQESALDFNADLDAALAELSQLRELIAAEQIPLNTKLNDLEVELMGLRAEFQKTSLLLDTRSLDLSNLERDIKEYSDENAYLSNLLLEFSRNFESRLHIAELQRYAKPVETARLAPENTNLSSAEVFAAQAALLEVALGRLEDALGGSKFEGTAIAEDGLVAKGNFVLAGPAALFATPDGRVVGTAEQRMDSLEPAVVGFEDPAQAAAALALTQSGSGSFLLDPTLGNAHKLADINETLWQHIKRGGVVMWPILVLAAAALLVGLFKWLHLSLVRRPSRAQLEELLAAAARRDKPAIVAAAAELRGPAGQMLQAGAEHADEPRELIEEVMYETVLATRLRLQRFLPFIAITASSAPLLGLLGTVTGIMNTFSLMTVFGTGDVKTLSSGISEALITTEYGLYVAIPALLLHAYLSRKARSLVDSMEQAGTAFLNQIGKTPLYKPAPGLEAELDDALSPLIEREQRAHEKQRSHAPTAAAPSTDQVREIVAELLAPIVKRSLEENPARSRSY